MDVPPADHVLWNQIISGTSNPDIKTLATRLLITRLRISVKTQGANLSDATLELHNFFVNNKFAHRDLAILGGAGK